MMHLLYNILCVGGWSALDFHIIVDKLYKRILTGLWELYLQFLKGVSGIKNELKM